MGRHKVGYLLRMNTHILAYLLYFAASVSDSTPSVLDRLSSDVTTLRLTGTASFTGSMPMNGLPFSATFAGTDSARVNMGGPFGTTAARLYAARDTFIVVNYLTRQVASGNVRTSDLSRMMMMNVTVEEMLAIVAGRLPGDLTRFVISGSRTDGLTLYAARDTSGGMEYALVDTVRLQLRQYQRKGAQGAILVDVKFDDYKPVDNIEIAHRVSIAVDDRKQSMSITVREAIVNSTIDETLIVDIPPSFERVTTR